MIIDSHHHFWDPSTADYPWMGDEHERIRRRFGPEELEPLLVAYGIDGTVVVQARSEFAETVSLLRIAASTQFVRGVVGWVDLTRSDVADVLAQLKQRHGHLVGVRHQVHDEPDPAWLSRSDVLQGLRAVAEADLAYDLLVTPRELDAACNVAVRLPELRLVLDHVGKPTLPEPDGRWVEGIAALARYANVTCKLSGLVTESPTGSSDFSSCVSVFRRALDLFGPTRCMIGSDWPVCLLAASYDTVNGLAAAALADLTLDEQAWLLGRTAIETYRLATLVTGAR